MEKAVFFRISLEMYEKLKYKSYCSNKSIAEIIRSALEKNLKE